MGNEGTAKKYGIEQLLYGLPGGDLSSFICASKNKYTIRQIIVHSPDNLQVLLDRILFVKKHPAHNFLTVIDTHTLESQTLCSSITKLYVIMDKMPYTLTQWKQSSSQVSEQSLLRIAEGCLSAALHLQQLGIDLEALSESDVYIDKQGNARIVHPYFSGQQSQMSFAASLLKLFAQFRGQAVADIVFGIIEDYHNEQCSLETAHNQVYKHLHGSMSQPLRRSKIDVTLSRKHTAFRKASRPSSCSIESSLQIEGQRDRCMHLQQIYKEIQTQHGDFSLADSMIDFDLDCDSSHKFPRKYLTKRNLAFKKSHRVYEQMELSLDVHSCDTQLKELKTREQSLRTNIPTDDDLQPSLLTLPGDWLLMIESRLDKQIE